MNRAMLGEVEFSVVFSDDPKRENEITDKSVERGADVSDHVKPIPDTLNISGVVVGDDAGTKLAKLLEYRNNGTLLTYIHRVWYDNMVINTFNSRHSVDVANGFEFDITLKHVRIATPKEVAITNVPPPIATRTKEIANAGTKQTKKR